MPTITFWNKKELFLKMSVKVASSFDYFSKHLLNAGPHCAVVY